MLDQLFQALLFYLFFSLFTVIGWPITSRYISNKYLAYVSSKPVGFALFGYCVWLLCDLHIFDYQDYNHITALLMGMLVISVILYHCFKSLMVNTALPPIRELLKLEWATMILYFSYLMLRSHNSGGGSERLMDVALLTAAGKTHFFPFLDPWYAGKTVNYYYYGQYLMSLLANLARVPYDVAYNTSLSLIYTQSIFLSATLVYAITDRKRAGILAGYLITTAGALYYAGRVVRDKWILHKPLSLFSSTHFYDPSYTIREIPSYSFTVGDLHAHVIALPFFILGLIFIYTLVNAPRPRFALVATMIPLFATSGLINGWDMVTLFAVMGVAVLIKSVHALRGATMHTLGAAVEWLAAPCIIAAGILLLMLPYLRDYHAPVMGIGFTPAFISEHHLENVQYPTSLLALLGLWGMFAACFALIWKTSRGVLHESEFMLSLAVTGILLIIGMELFFVRDIYSIANPAYFRSNTTFKFGFHTWIILCIVFAVWMDKVCLVAKDRYYKWGARLLILTAVTGGAIYPYHAVKHYYLGNDNNLNLSVAQWMQVLYPGDYDTVNYINSTVPDRVVIAEAVGDSYSNHARITSYTGMITPMGWMTHEWTWRFYPPAPGSDDTGWDAVARASGDVHLLYDTPDITKAMRIIKKHNIQYVVVGPLEHEEYPHMQEMKFSQLGRLVFQSEDTRLYKINSNIMQLKP